MLTLTVTVTLGLNTALVSDVEKPAAAEFKTRVTSIKKSQSYSLSTSWMR